MAGRRGDCLNSSSRAGRRVVRVLRVVSFHPIRIKIAKFVLILSNLTTLSTLTNLIRRGECSAVTTYSAYDAQTDGIGSRGYNTALRVAYTGISPPDVVGMARKPPKTAAPSKS